MATLLVLGGASAANAAEITSPGDPHTVTSYTFTVSGTGTPGNYIALAQCNADLGGLNGSDCNAASQVGGVLIDGSGNWSASITVDDAFANSSVSGVPTHGGTTDCFVDECQVQSSEYTSWFPTAPPVDFGSLTLVF
jgi:hypothetical protein